MKTVVILLCVLALSAAEQETFKLPQDVVNKIQKEAEKCAEEFKVDPNIIVKVAAEAIPDNEAVGKFLLCFGIKLGYADNVGHLAVEKISSVVKDHPLVGQFKEALTKCNEDTKETPHATIMAMQQCFLERTPIRLLF